MSTYGPFSVSLSLPGTGYTNRTWYRQKPITAAPLPFEMDKAYNLYGDGDPLSWATFAVDPYSPDWIAVTNRCQQKIVDQIGSASSAWAANLATWKQSHGMIVARAGQLLKAVRALRRGSFKSAAYALGIRKPKPSHVKSLASQWLELSYGWIPLIQDIHSSVETLQAPLPKLDLRARASLRGRTRRMNSITVGTWDCFVTAGCRIIGIHPGALLANQLGLVNPLSVAWEVVPFSFVVDWFIPVGTFLQNFTDFVGVDVDRQFTTQYGIHTLEMNDYRPGGTHWGKRRVQVKRVLSLPTYRLRPRFTGFYSMRGANAIALLIGGLKSLK